MTWLKNGYSLFMIIGLLLLPGILFAAGIGIDPIHIHLSQKKAFAALTVRNQNPEPITLQLGVKRWSQKNGQDDYQDTRDLLVVPPMMTIAPGESQVVRIALQRLPDKSQELTYRLFFHQLPIGDSFKKSGIHTLLRILVPVFVAPIINNQPKQLVWQGTIVGKELALSVQNKSNLHVQITHLLLTGSWDKKPLLSQQVFHYVLPQQSYTWHLLLTNAQGVTRDDNSLQRKQLPKMQLTATTNWGILKDQIPILTTTKNQSVA